MIKHLTPRHINVRKLIERKMFNLLFHEYHMGISIKDITEVLKDYAENLTPEDLKIEIDKRYEENRKWRAEMHEKIKNFEITYDI